VYHLIHLRTFLDAYRAGSLTRAAQRLGITQPAASAHIASLETMLGKPLFVRKARGVAPTPAADDLARAIAAPEFKIMAALTPPTDTIRFPAPELHALRPLFSAKLPGRRIALPGRAAICLGAFPRP
jgi:hypothetical protein